MGAGGRGQGCRLGSPESPRLGPVTVRGAWTSCRAPDSAQRPPLAAPHLTGRTQPQRTPGTRRPPGPGTCGPRPPGFPPLLLLGLPPVSATPTLQRNQGGRGRGDSHLTRTSRHPPLLRAGTPTARKPRPPPRPAALLPTSPRQPPSLPAPPTCSPWATAHPAPQAQPRRLSGGPCVGVHRHHMPLPQQLALREPWPWAPDCWAFSPSDRVYHTPQSQGRASAQPHHRPQATPDGGCA